MKEHSFVWLEEDQEYVEWLITFLHQSSYGHQVELRTFTTKELAEQYLQQEVNKPLVIGSRPWIEAIGIPPEEQRTVILDNQRTEELEDPATGSVILYKYQSLSRLFSTLCQIDLRRREKHGLNGGHAVKLFGVYSATGNCGKSAIAVNIARNLASRHHHVLYLSLENVGTGDQMLRENPGTEQEGEQFSRLMYYLKTDAGKFAAQLNAVKRHDPNSGLDYISFAYQAREMEAMTRDDVRSLLERIVSLKLYDRIVLDLESSLHERVIGALECCDQIIWIIQDDAICLHKTRIVHKSLPRLSRIHYTVNKYTGRMTADTIRHGFEPKFFLPYIPEWKQVTNPVDLVKHRIYQEAVHVLVNGLENSMQGGSSIHGDKHCGA